MGKIMDLLNTLVKIQDSNPPDTIVTNTGDINNKITSNHDKIQQKPDIDIMQISNINLTDTTTYMLDTRDKEDCLGCRIVGSLTLATIGALFCFALSKKYRSSEIKLQRALLAVNGYVIATVFTSLSIMRLFNVGIFSENKSFGDILKQDLESLKKISQFVDKKES